MAGFHFNNALFRISAVFDRLPKAFGAMLQHGRRMPSGKGCGQDKEAHDIRDEVNDLKHKASGVFRKRRRVLKDATTAIDQLLDLAETLSAKNPEAEAGIAVAQGNNTVHVISALRQLVVPCRYA
jgi:hypothetical protein